MFVYIVILEILYRIIIFFMYNVCVQEYNLNIIDFTSYTENSYFVSIENNYYENVNIFRRWLTKQN